MQRLQQRLQFSLPRRTKQGCALSLSVPLEFHCTYLIENRVVNPMIMPRRVPTSDTKERMNIGIVVSNGAKRVQVTSAASDTLASLYSRRPSSSSLMKLLYAVSKPYYPRWKIDHFEAPANEPMVNSQKIIPNPAFKPIFVPMLCRQHEVIRF